MYSDAMPFAARAPTTAPAEVPTMARRDGAPAGLRLERVERPDQPGGADDAPCPQDETHTHAATVPAGTDCQAVPLALDGVRKGPRSRKNGSAAALGGEESACGSRTSPA